MVASGAPETWWSPISSRRAVATRRVTSAFPGRWHENVCLGRLRLERRRTAWENAISREARQHGRPSTDSAHPGATETDRAAVLVFDPDGKNRKVFATGIRNCVGLAVQPANGSLWCSTNERDGLGDDLVPDYVTRVKEHGFYGWPWFYLGAHEDPRHEGSDPISPPA